MTRRLSTRASTLVAALMVSVFAGEAFADLSHTKTYTRNAFGAVTEVTETWGSADTDGIAATSRVTSYTYDAKVRHREIETNPLSHSETTTYDPLHGLPSTKTGPNGLTTTWTQDAFGRVTNEIRADGTETNTYRYVCDGDSVCRTHEALVTVTVTDGAPTTTVYQDKLYREIRKSTVMLDGRTVHVDTEYDALGRVARKSEPYFDSVTPLWTTITYDILGRPLLTTRPDTSTQSVVYNGLEQVSTNELGQTKTVINDALGRMVEARDNDNNATTYVYDAIGQMISMTDPVANTTTTAYDTRGNRTSMTDPDKGTWTYRYNALSQLVEQTDAKGQKTAITYDVLGRMLTRTDDATGNLQTATWVYDTATKGISKVHTSTSNGYTVTSSYDSLGRPSGTTETIDGVAYPMSVTYDSFGRPEDSVYPNGLVVRNVYNSNGYLETVKNAVTNLEYWKALAVDARGNITQSRLGNGVESSKVYNAQTGYLESIYSNKGASVVQNLTYNFNVLGNLNNRTDVANSLTDVFTYDTLNRVTNTASTVSGIITNVAVAYDANGNITSKSDVGTYSYGQAHGACASGHAGPHAVTTVAGTKNATYCYDANGNMTSGDGRVVSYTAFDKPNQINLGTSSVSISYGPDQARFKRVDTTAAGTTRTTYVGGKAFELIDRAGVIERKTYIGDFAVVTEIGVTGSTTVATSYLLRDHLGSIDTITDEAGTVIEQMSFDSWGKRRNIDWTPMVSSTAYITTLTTRGFTGHEQLDSVGLVHMNGRVYDPELGRFLSADPFLQDSSNLQSWNRYTYVLNNPLSLTDPTGYFFGKIFKSIGKFLASAFKAIGSVVKAALDVPIVRSLIQIVGCAPPHGFVTCAPTVVALTLAAGGSLADAFKAAAFSVAQMGIWSAVGTFLEPLKATLGAGFAFAKSAVHGVVGGALSVAQGGRFSTGFATNAIGGFVGALTTGSNSALGRIRGLGGTTIRAALSGLAGGAASKLTGGKFENGFVTAAFAHLYNAEVHMSAGVSLPGLVREWWAGITGEPMITQGGEIGIAVVVPSAILKWDNGPRIIVKGEYDLALFATATIDEPESGTFALGHRLTRGAKGYFSFGASTAKSAAQIAGIGGQAGIFVGTGGVTYNSDPQNWGVDFQFGLGLEANSSGTATSSFSVFDFTAHSFKE